MTSVLETDLRNGCTGTSRWIIQAYSAPSGVGDHMLDLCFSTC